MVTADIKVFSNLIDSTGIPFFLKYNGNGQTKIKAPATQPLLYRNRTGTVSKTD
jgi:hypothetical protein